VERGVADRRRSSVKGRKGIYTKEWEVKSSNNLATVTKWTTHLFVISEPWVYSQRFRSYSEVQ